MTATIEDLNFVLLGMTDIHGGLRGKALTRAEFQAAAERGWAPLGDLFLALDPVDVAIDYPGIGLASGSPDLHLRPELATLRALHLRPGWGICIGELLWRDGTPCDLYSRTVLRRSLERAAAAGFTVRAALEYEVRVWDAHGVPMSNGIQYSLADTAGVFGLIEEVQRMCESLDLDLRVAHTEGGNGLLEFNIAYRDGLRAADEATLFKTCFKQLARSLGYRVSFMAKPIAGEEGSSGHLHLSLWDGEGHNCFASDGSGPHGLSSILAGAIAGILHHLPAMCLLYNPTINSYKRTLPNIFVGVNQSWGPENRFSALRVITTSPAASRVELRRPGADANPYLVLAAALESALAGIAQNLTPPHPTEGNATNLTPDAIPPLPSSLESALAAFQADPAVPDFFDRAFIEYFTATRQWELEAWRWAVSDWERERYEHV
jgi:glutamine synthetase